MIHSYPWYVADWRSSETRIKLSPAERCLYRELLDYCWIEGSLPVEEPLLAAIAAFEVREFRKCWSAVKPLFIEQDGRLTHHRVVDGRDKLQSWNESRREAGRRGGLNAAKAYAKSRSDSSSDSSSNGHKLLLKQSSSKASKLLLKPSASTSTSTSASEEIPPSPQPILPTEGEPAYWVERLTTRHPLPSDERFPATFCNDNLHRLGEDPVRYAVFMAEVCAGLDAWCEYWAGDGNQYAKNLNDWLLGRGWKKRPPTRGQGQKRNGRYELLEDDDNAAQ